MMPVRRDVRFALPPERAVDWHHEGPALTHLLNALSLLFPAGERFFMDSVRHYRDRITDSELKRQVAGFIGQEAMHTREHVEYNDLLEAAKLPAHKLDKRLWRGFGLLRKFSPPSIQLAVTIALEHYTAMLANYLLSDPHHHVGGVEGYRLMWMWHAFEETEHKSVSYDVWNAVMKPGVASYLLRTVTMLVTTVFFWGILFDWNVRLLIAHRRHHGKIGLRNMGRLVQHVWGPLKGIIPSIFQEWLDYFRPGFHPWDHDNRHYLNNLDGLIDSIERANRTYAAQAAPRRVPLHPAAAAQA